MKLYDFKKKSSKDSKLSWKTKSVVKILIALILIILIAIFAFLYMKNEDFRIWVDKNIFNKEITNENVATIDIDSENIPYIYAYDKYVVTLEKNNLKAYSANGKKEIDIDISVTKPIFSSNNRFLLIAESYGKKAYLISTQGILWEKNIEGEISRVNVNKNGYVSIAITRRRV